MARFARLKDGFGVLVLICLALLAALFAPVPAQAYGPAGGAVHTYDCWAIGAVGYPSSGGCAASILAIRDGDVGKWLQTCNAGSGNAYACSFYEWADCNPPGSGGCNFRWRKFTYATNASSINNAQLGYVKSTKTDQECKGAEYLKLGDGTCVCQPGYAPGAGGTCVANDCPDPGLIAGSEGKKFVYDNLSDGGASVCFDGCLITGSMGAASQGDWYILGPFYNTGQKCNPAGQGGTAQPGGGPNSGGVPPVDDTDKCAAGQCPGTVNGTQVCVACDSTTTGDYHGNGNGGTWSQTTCSNGTCYTRGGTVDENGNQLPPDDWDVGSGGGYPQANPGGGTSGNCTGADCQSQDKFCEDNPDSIMCKSSTWGGTCESSFACDGDAVQCAIAREQHVRNCAMFDTETELSGKGRAAANGEAQPDGHPFKNAAETSINFSEKIDMTNPLVGGCPAGRSVTVAGYSLVIVTPGLCDSLEILGNIVVALGSLLSIFIVFKG